MTNRFGLDLHPKEVRWAAAEGVSEDIIAAVLLLHHSSVDEIAPQLSAAELGKVIELVGPRARPRRAARRELHREAPKGVTPGGPRPGRRAINCSRTIRIRHCWAAHR
jgi:hypothetical protein